MPGARRQGISTAFATLPSIINPGFNKQSGTFAGATQVFQVPHEDAEGDLETKLARMAATIEAMSGKV